MMPEFVRREERSSDVDRHSGTERASTDGQLGDDIDRRESTQRHRELQRLLDSRGDDAQAPAQRIETTSQRGAPVQRSVDESLPVPSGSGVTQFGGKTKTGVGAIAGAGAGAAAELGIGAATGAAIGSAFPIIGTAIGVVVGAGLGYLIHWRKVRRMAAQQAQQPQQPQAAVVEGEHPRVALTDEEQANQNFRLLPMLSFYQNEALFPTAEQEAATAIVYTINDQGLLVRADNPATLLTTNRIFDPDDLMDLGAALSILMDEGIADQFEHATPNAVVQAATAIGGTYIWVMAGDGRIYAAQKDVGSLHHSSFLGGAAIVAGGSIRVTNGVVQRIDNVSGHYRPGPAYLWQALVSMQNRGVNLANVQIAVRDVQNIPNAAAFVAAFNPMQQPQFFDTATATAFLQQRFQGGGA